MKENELISLFPRKYAPYFREIENRFMDVQEIRFRVGQPTTIRMKNEEYFLTTEGRLTQNEHHLLRISAEELMENLDFLCQHSLYAFDEEIKRGYLTVKGGHRVGIVGQTVVDEHGIFRIRNFSSLNYRISHQIIGAANHLLHYFYEKDKVKNVLIVSPPGCGKTTILRDAVRLISDGNRHAGGKNVCVVDERSEIGGSYLGIPQNDIGKRTDILDGCPKAEGMMMVLRAMAPELIAVDEIGSEQDIAAIREIASCGCSLIATAHAECTQGLNLRPTIQTCLDESLFETIIVLSARNGVGTLEHVYCRQEGGFQRTK